MNRRNTRLTTAEFIERARKIHGKKYDYSKVEYVNMHTNVTIICKKHGSFEQRPSKHINRKQHCPECALLQRSKKRTISLESFIKKANEIHDNKYDYSKVKIKNTRNDVTIICKDHGEFKQTPSKHIHVFHGCPKCKNKKEGRIAEYLLKREVVFRQHKIKRKFYDFYLPKYNLLIERDGEQHYGRGFADFMNISTKENQAQQQNNDKLKTKLAKEAGFRIARIPYWLNKNEEEIEIENILAGKPSYPDVPDLKQAKTKPKPRRLENKRKG